jgi:hypothetical protein
MNQEAVSRKRDPAVIRNATFPELQSERFRARIEITMPASFEETENTFAPKLMAETTWRFGPPSSIEKLFKLA